MKILLTNDDGIKAKGLTALEEVLVSKGHEVWVCAPESQRSSSSHALSFMRDLFVNKVSERHYACSGFPADCSLVAITGAFGETDFDLVISGINQGYNISTDIIYSGTCGAAAEAVLRNKKALAVSCGHDKDGNFCYKEAADFVAEHLEMLSEAASIRYTFVNVNVPCGADGTWCVTDIGRMDYGDILVNGEAKGSVKLVGTGKNPVFTGDSIEETDYHCIYNRSLITVSSVSVFPTTCMQGQDILNSYKN